MKRASGVSKASKWAVREAERIVEALLHALPLTLRHPSNEVAEIARALDKAAARENRASIRLCFEGKARHDGGEILYRLERRRARLYGRAGK